MHLNAQGFASSFQKGFEDGSPNSRERTDPWADSLSSPQGQQGASYGFLEAPGKPVEEAGEVEQDRGRWGKTLCRPQVAYTELVPQMSQQWKKLIGNSFC